MDIERVKRIIDKNFKPFERAGKNAQIRRNDPEYCFVNDLWWKLYVRRTKRQTKRILHNMTLEELGEQWARYEIEREV